VSAAPAEPTELQANLCRRSSLSLAAPDSTADVFACCRWESTDEPSTALTKMTPGGVPEQIILPGNIVVRIPSQHGFFKALF